MSSVNPTLQQNEETYRQYTDTMSLGGGSSCSNAAYESSKRPYLGVYVKDEKNYSSMVDVEQVSS